MDRIDDRLLTLAQVGEVLPLSRGALYKLFREGELASYKVGGRRLVRRADLDAFLARHAERALGAAS